MIDLNQLKKAHIFTKPFRFGLIENPFSDRQESLQLVRTFPETHFERCEHEGGHFFRRPLIVKGEEEIYRRDDLDETAIRLGELFLSEAYRDTLAETTGLPLKGKTVEAWFWTYDEHTVFEPHLDFETKVLTQVFYLVEDWEAKDGGLLYILNSNSTEDIAYAVTPRLDLSSLIFRSDDSWHYLTPISPDAPTVRNSITVHFHH